MPDLLIELFSEEIPARMQARAAADLKRLITDGLVAAGLTYGSAGAFCTPRRLVLSVDGLTAASPDTREERKGPRVAAPDKALQGFLRATGLTRDQLDKRDDKKGQVWFAVIERAGRPADEIVADVLEHTIRNFPWPKSMRWGTGGLKWVRPLHAILCIHSDESGARVVALDIDGIKAGDTTRGHPFMSKGVIKVTGFDDYVSKLQKAHVMLDAGVRSDHIWNDATNVAFAQGLEVVEDKGLLAEVSGLVEFPVVLMGEIDQMFLDLPPEVLQTSMREHQKFFSVKNPKSGRIEKFITVANRATKDGGKAILAGNQKVLFARLSDARFFWENDLRTVKAVGLEGMGKPLADVTFHNKLGSQADRIARIEVLAREIAPFVGADPDLAAQAARVAKADLCSEMVYEFPELQGLMGRYYAQAEGLDDTVALTCAQHYSPLGPSDDVPSRPISVAVALADKIDTLVGFWWISEKPTGSKDPFALRRASLGVIRLILDNEIKLPMLELILHAYEPLDQDLRREILHEEEEADNEAAKRLGVPVQVFDDWRSKISEEKRQQGGETEFEKRLFSIDLRNIPHPGSDLLSFFHDRLKVYLRNQGIRHDVIDACIAMPGNDDLSLLVKRATALAAFLKSDDGENLLQGFKRANNILTQAEEKDGVEYSYGADVKFAESEVEKALFTALDQQGGAISSAIEAEDFAAAMHGMAALRTPIDAFFSNVQVNAENAIVRRNRLNLLGDIRKICVAVADLTRIEG